MYLSYLLLGIRSYLKLTHVYFKTLCLSLPYFRVQEMLLKLVVVITFIIGFGLVQEISAQGNSKSVTGKVIGADNKPIEGATISLIGTTKATTSDKTGKYTISVPGNSVLIYSFIGYTSKQEFVNNRAEINVTLFIETKEVDEVVVIGYQTVRRKQQIG